MEEKKILVINPGSTSTKIGLFIGEKQLFVTNIEHLDKDINAFSSVFEQFDFRLNAIKAVLEEQKIDLSTLDGVIGRGGLLRSIPSGIYQINDKMLEELKSAARGEHPSNLGAFFARHFGQALNIPYWIADPVAVDEMLDFVKITGIKEIKRASLFHALNQKSVVRKIAKQLNKNVEDTNFVVAHLGGGFSFGTHIKGKVVDVSNAIYGEASFSPERVGQVPGVLFYEYALKNNLSLSQVKKIFGKEGGLYSHFKSKDMRYIFEKDNDLENKDLIWEAICYQISKSIMAYTTLAKGKLDGIIITGGIANSKQLVAKVKEYIDWVAPIYIVPGEDELSALNEMAQLVLNNKIETKEY
ncbi:MAG: butyrate kinase [Mycoplasma sp.]|nr:butyrate kinase [Mycoplasma sp.]